MKQKTGKVYLVGAGPGDPGLLTLRGCELLRQAEVVFYDYLANPLLLNHAASTAELVCLGRHGQGRVLEQEEINRQVIAAAKSGKQVVRLKGGDPSIFARAGEEIAALEAAGIRYEVVPGVTAALAASSYAGVPLTHRDHASCVAFVTGRECCDKAGSALDLANLAKFPGTLVFYMGVTTAPVWAGELVKHGKSADTPVAIVRHCSLPKQQTVLTTLGELPEVLVSRKIRPPAIVIVGEAVTARSANGWFTSRPLFGQTVLVTRPARQAASLSLQLNALGATTLLQPAIEIEPVDDWAKVDAAIENLATFDWLVFSSANGVQYFLERLFATGGDLRTLAACRLATIGPATATALANYHLHTDLQPEEYRAEALAAQLAPESQGKRILLLRASRGREVLAETLADAGAEIEQVVVYESRDTAKPQAEIVDALAAGQIDWVTVTSSAIARSLVKLFGASLQRTKLAAISPLTAGVLDEAGFPPKVVATDYTSEGLLNAIVASKSE
ncbi:MAG: uroporphyrinogen-III C-methyltransferase [Planctomycetes bacterium]|nr:uroporphyrinogen-III C-methyltransferase [Planctomycetota bacterium]